MERMAWIAWIVGFFSWAPIQPAQAQSVSPVVLPRPFVPLRFSHAKHLSRQGLRCAACHPRAHRSKNSTDVLTAKKKSCLKCHPEARVPPGFGRRGHRQNKRCRRCHTRFYPNGFPLPSRWPKPRLTFSHALHGRKGVGCAKCHPGVKKSRKPGRLHLVRMASCRACHRRRNASLRCVSCHRKKNSHRLQTAFKEGKLKPSGTLGLLNHTAGFRRQHKKAATAHRKQCRYCHTRSTCLRCHGGLRKVLSIHPGNYRLRHGAEARRRPQRCKACHTRQRFCLGCHQRMGVSSTSNNPAYGPRGRKKYHPRNWASALSRARTRNRHAIHARRSIGACVGCHRESTCQRCHATRSVGGYGHSPHGSGFARSTRCRRAVRRSKRACLKCHRVTDRHLRCLK